MSVEDDFHKALNRLKHWHADSTKAQNFDGPSISHTKPGAVELRLQTYPHESYWWGRWRLAKGETGRREVVEELEQEYENLSTSPSHKHKFIINTLEWKQGIATHEGEARYVARLYGVGLSTVYKYRKMHG